MAWRSSSGTAAGSRRLRASASTSSWPTRTMSRQTIATWRTCTSSRWMPSPAEALALMTSADAEIRQGIKEYANWPTIPQLYVNGEFVGGSDIMREMYQSGELQKLIQEAKQQA